MGYSTREGRIEEWYKALRSEGRGDTQARDQTLAICYEDFSEEE
jgi:hypothetical protein